MYVNNNIYEINSNLIKILFMTNNYYFYNLKKTFKNDKHNYDVFSERFTLLWLETTRKKQIERSVNYERNLLTYSDQHMLKDMWVKINKNLRKSYGNLVLPKNYLENNLWYKDYTLEQFYFIEKNLLTVNYLELSNYQFKSKYKALSSYNLIIEPVSTVHIKEAYTSVDSEYENFLTSDNVQTRFDYYFQEIFRRPIKFLISFFFPYIVIGFIEFLFLFLFFNFLFEWHQLFCLLFDPDDYIFIFFYSFFDYFQYHTDLFYMYINPLGLSVNLRLFFFFFFLITFIIWVFDIFDTANLYFSYINDYNMDEIGEDDEDDSEYDDDETATTVEDEDINIHGADEFNILTTLTISLIYNIIFVSSFIFFYMTYEWWFYSIDLTFLFLSGFQSIFCYLLTLLNIFYVFSIDYPRISSLFILFIFFIILFFSFWIIFWQFRVEEYKRVYRGHYFLIPSFEKLWARFVSKSDIINSTFGFKALMLFGTLIKDLWFFIISRFGYYKQLLSVDMQVDTDDYIYVIIKGVYQIFILILRLLFLIILLIISILLFNFIVNYFGILKNLDFILFKLVYKLKLVNFVNFDFNFGNILEYIIFRVKNLFKNSLNLDVKYIFIFGFQFLFKSFIILFKIFKFIIDIFFVFVLNLMLFCFKFIISFFNFSFDLDLTFIFDSYDKTFFFYYWFFEVLNLFYLFIPWFVIICNFMQWNPFVVDAFNYLLVSNSVDLHYPSLPNKITTITSLEYKNFIKFSSDSLSLFQSNFLFYCFFDTPYFEFNRVDGVLHNYKDWYIFNKRKFENKNRTLFRKRYYMNKASLAFQNKKKFNRLKNFFSLFFDLDYNIWLNKKRINIFQFKLNNKFVKSFDKLVSSPVNTISFLNYQKVNQSFNIFENSSNKFNVYFYNLKLLDYLEKKHTVKLLKYKVIKKLDLKLDKQRLLSFRGYCLKINNKINSSNFSNLFYEKHLELYRKDLYNGILFGYSANYFNLLDYNVKLLLKNKYLFNDETLFLKKKVKKFNNKRSIIFNKFLINSFSFRKKKKDLIWFNLYFDLKNKYGNKSCYLKEYKILLKKYDGFLMKKKVKEFQLFKNFLCLNKKFYYDYKGFIKLSNKKFSLLNFNLVNYQVSGKKYLLKKSFNKYFFMFDQPKCFKKFYKFLTILNKKNTDIIYSIKKHKLETYFTKYYVLARAGITPRYGLVSYEKNSNKEMNVKQQLSNFFFKRDNVKNEKFLKYYDKYPFKKNFTTTKNLRGKSRYFLLTKHFTSRIPLRNTSLGTRGYFWWMRQLTNGPTFYKYKIMKPLRNIKYFYDDFEKIKRKRIFKYRQGHPFAKVRKYGRIYRYSKKMYQFFNVNFLFNNNYPLILYISYYLTYFQILQNILTLPQSSIFFSFLVGSLIWFYFIVSFYLLGFFIIYLFCVYSFEYIFYNWYLLKQKKKIRFKYITLYHETFSILNSYIDRLKDFKKDKDKELARQASYATFEEIPELDEHAELTRWKKLFGFSKVREESSPVIFISFMDQYKRDKSVILAFSNYITQRFFESFFFKFKRSIISFFFPQTTLVRSKKHLYYYILEYDSHFKSLTINDADDKELMRYKKIYGETSDLFNRKDHQMPFIVYFNQEFGYISFLVFVLYEENKGDGVEISGKNNNKDINK